MPRKRKHSYSDSDSDWEPPAKRKKLNQTKTATKTKTSTRKPGQVSKQRQKKQTPTKRKSRKSCHQQLTRRRRRVPEEMDIDNGNDSDDDSDIEILCSVSKKSCKKTTKTKTKTKTKAKTKTKKQISKETRLPKIKKQKRSSRNKFQPMASNPVTIPDFDALICGFFRSCLSSEESMSMDSLHRMPKEVSNVICEYQRNIRYVEVNFVWTHKYACCSDQQHCQRLKNNRGNYVFVRNPNNVFDSNAIRIMTRSEEAVGHIPRDLAAVLAPLLDQAKIELECVGGVKTRPCCEMVQIVPRASMYDEDWGRVLQLFLVTTPFDQNRYVDTKERNP